MEHEVTIQYSSLLIFKFGCCAVEIFYFFYNSKILFWKIK